jgi:hypothetical protein
LCRSCAPHREAAEAPDLCPVGTRLRRQLPKSANVGNSFEASCGTERLRNSGEVLY